MYCENSRQNAGQCIFSRYIVWLSVYCSVFMLFQYAVCFLPQHTGCFLPNGFCPLGLQKFLAKRIKNLLLNSASIGPILKTEQCYCYIVVPWLHSICTFYTLIFFTRISVRKSQVMSTSSSCENEHYACSGLGIRETVAYRNPCNNICRKCAKRIGE